MINTETLVLQQIESLLHIPRVEINHAQSFVALGGSSLDAVSLSQACRQSGILLSVPDILRALSVADIVQAAAYNPPVDDAIYTPSTLFNGIISPDAASTRRPERHPATEMQLAFIHGSQARPGTNIIRHLQPCAREQLTILKRAWQAVLAAEPIFRTRIQLEDGAGYLVEMTDSAAFEWEEIVARSDEEYHAILEETPPVTDVRSRFTAVIQQYPGARPGACIVWSVHHALVDGFSMSILLDKVEKAARGEPVHPGPSFARLAGQLHRLQRTMQDQGRAFWEGQKARFPGASDGILLPPPREAPGTTRSLHLTITPDTPWPQLRAHAQEHGVTAASTYMAAWALVLSQFGDADTVVFGIVVSGRNLPLPGVAGTVGPLVNTLPLHVAMEKTMMSTELLRTVFAQLLELGSFQWTTPDHGYRRAFSSAVAMQSETAMSKELVGSDATHSSKTLINSDIPLSVMVAPAGEIHIHYLNTHFSRDQVELLGRQYSRALRALCRPSYTVEMCLEDLLAASFRQRLLELGNCHSGLTTETSVHDDLVTLFERAAATDPTALALEHGPHSMTYQQLDEKSSRLAGWLTDVVQIRRGEVVCVHADQSMHWIVAIYGILKAGAVYCPLNQNLTPELRSSMFESSTSRVLLVPNASSKVAQPPTAQSLITVEEVLASDEDGLALPPRDSPTPAATAYLCFTSGSTGKPKGVLCTHRGLVAFQRDVEVRLFAVPGKRVAQLMSVSFDGSIHEIFSALSYGATLVLPDGTGPFDHLQRVDSAILTPSVAKILEPTDFPALTNVCSYYP
jgi:non-ribosomal peptide synthetase component F